ncbi:hypothetical protein PV325_007965 [Microctonus aethiopoides]|uniref:THAP4-like heme-binding domain-containing protein n=1 Tax=Microctonus aethiopoides TaxID=144406 RepID=A0AA39F6B2_9HYME|nr:hypothetical protein PV325_007965 [Microctonus aethiopoides]KAK0098093.1 hypothetical protein PV326_011281 [Microctonus aethiopoides]KAK0163715.1 hypothetical protein PV328_002419 [Microctonus aethiopoides]
MNQLPLHNALKSLEWLEGTWRTAEAPGEGQLPTKSSFQYYEEIKFTSIGQPMLNYEAQSWNAEGKNPLHREVGVLKIVQGTNRVKLLLSHNFGLTTIEEGEVNHNHIQLESTSIERMTEGTRDPVVIKLQRKFKGDGNHLEHTVYMATSTNPQLTQHIHARYVKLET